jgi:hypothetical protein
MWLFGVYLLPNFFRLIFSHSAKRTHFLVMKQVMANLRAAARTASNLPALSQSQIAHRWRLDADTVRKIIRDHHLLPVPGPWKRARYSMLDVWRIEGIPHTVALDTSLHGDLLEPLATASDLAVQCHCTPATVRNWAREGVLPCLRLGGSVRFHIFAVRGVLSDF